MDRRGNDKNRNLPWRSRPVQAPKRRNQPVFIDYSTGVARQVEQPVPKADPEPTPPDKKEEKKAEQPQAEQVVQSTPNLWAAVKATGQKGLWIAVASIILLIYIVWGIIVYAQGPAGGNPTHIPWLFGYVSSLSMVIPGRQVAHTVWAVTAVVSLLGLVIYSGLRFKPKYKEGNLRAGIGLVTIASLLWTMPHIGNWYVPYNAYSQRYNSLKQYQEQQVSNGQQAQTDRALRTQALQQVITRRYIEQEASKYKIKVNQSDIDKKYKESVSKAGGEENLKKQLQQYLGWTVADYKQDIKQSLLKDKLNTKLKAKYRGEADAYAQELKKTTVHIYVKGLSWNPKFRQVQDDN